MGILDIFKAKYHGNMNLGAESETGVKIRQQNADLKRRRMELELQKAELEGERDRLRIEYDMERLRQNLNELREVDEDYEEPSGIEDTLLTTLLSKVLNGQQQQNTAVPVTPVVPKEISIDQIEAIWDSQNAQTRAFIKTLDDNQIRDELKKRIPDMSDSSINRAIEFIHKEKLKKTGWLSKK